MFIWDTNILRHYGDNHPMVVAHVNRVPETEIVLPAVVVAEVLRGRCDYVLKAVPDKVQLATELLLATLQMLRTFNIMPFDPATSNVFKKLAAKNPRHKRYVDLMVAAMALAGNHIIVTRNQKDFADLLPKNQLQNWIDNPPTSSTP